MRRAHGAGEDERGVDQRADDDAVENGGAEARKPTGERELTARRDIGHIGLRRGIGIRRIHVRETLPFCIFGEDYREIVPHCGWLGRRQLGRHPAGRAWAVVHDTGIEPVTPAV